MKSSLFVLLCCSFLQIDSCFESKLPEDRLVKLEEDVRDLSQKVDVLISFMEGLVTNEKEKFAENAQHNVIPQLNDTTIEERVAILEYQVAGHTDDITNLETDLEAVEDEVTVLASGQVLQDERIVELEIDSDGFEDAIVILEETVTSVDNKLTAVNYTLSEEVSELDTGLVLLDDAVVEIDGRVENIEAELVTMAETIDAIDNRVTHLEIAGTVAFQADLNQYTSIPAESYVIFEGVTVNLGDGYNTTTGEFTVPSGGAGLYFFYVNFYLDDQEAAAFRIDRNDEGGFCRAEADMNNIGVNDKGTASNGCITMLDEGDVVHVFYDSGTDDTPVINSGLNRNMFTGFRIAPE